MNLPDAIERVRRLRSEALIRSGKWTSLDSEVSEAHATDALALAVCLEAIEAKRSPISSDKSGTPEPWDGGNGK